MNSASNNESTLLKRALAGDREAFGELYLMHMDAIYRYIYFRIGEKCDAEDLTEKVFINAWQGLPRYRNNGHSFSCWLYRIAHNAVIDFCRSQRKKSKCPEVIEMDCEEYDSALAIPANNQEDANTLAEAITKLPDEQQQIIVLRFIEGMSHPEISRIMNKSEGACRMLQNRALVALNHLMSNS